MPRDSLVKSFIRSHLHYADVILANPAMQRFFNRIESAEYNAALAIRGATWGTSKEKLYQELGLETMKERKVVSKTLFFF